MRNKKHIVFSTKKTMLSLFLALFFLLFPFFSQKASAWDGIPSAMLNRAIAEIQDNIKGIIMGAAKQTAVRILNDEVNALIDGTIGGAVRFITDWEDYLVKMPERVATQYVNDYVSQVTGGRGSSSYRGSRSSGLFSVNSEGFKTRRLAMFDPANAQSELDVWDESNYTTETISSYMETYKQIGQEVAENNANTVPQVELKIHPNQMLDPNTNSGFKNVALYTRGVNNPWGYRDLLEQVKREKEATSRQIQASQSVAYQGFTGGGTDGKVTEPGILLKEKIANIEDLGNKIIANARNIPEVITTVVTNAITKAVQKGVGMVQQKIHQEVANVRRQIVNNVNTNLQKVGPRAVFEKQRY